ncbi:MAG: N-acetyltransferase [Planctomycetota bacterium]|jgi:amino-acid N-acetyltransferase
MDYIEPPPAPKRHGKKPKGKVRKAPLKDTDQRQIVIQKAQIRDVEEILELVNGFAASNLMLPRGPQYLYENIRDFVIASDRDVPVYSLTETREVLHLIVACASLHVLWKDIAEIRALAIHPDYQQLGLGSKLVEYMKQEAKLLGIKRLYTFTLTEDFFKTLGFKRQNRAELPAKVWGECSRCPKYFQCDEVGMVLEF